MYLHHLQGVFSYVTKVTKSVILIKLKDPLKMMLIHRNVSEYCTE